MNIQDIVKQTGISKRTIYYYINEHLVTPISNKQNGYFSFSEEDLEKLLLIKRLRILQLPIQDIKQILLHPLTSNVYLHKQLDYLLKQQKELTHTIDSLDSILDTMPFTPSVTTLYEQLENIDSLLNTTVINTHKDARLLMIYMYGEFLGIEMLTYKKFLISELIQALERQMDTTLYFVKEYFDFVEPIDIENSAVKQHEHMEYIMELPIDQIDTYAQIMFDKLTKVMSSTSLKSRWKAIYPTVILPHITFSIKEANNLLLEINPMFKQYQHKLHLCLDTLRSILYQEKHQDILTQVLNLIPEHVLIEHNFIELDVLSNLENSAFMIVKNLAFLRPSDINE